MDVFLLGARNAVGFKKTGKLELAAAFYMFYNAMVSS